MQKKENCPLSYRKVHSMFLEWWNTTKSISTIWQKFSCLLVEGIAKICTQMKTHSAVAFWAANPANLAAIFCPPCLGLCLVNLKSYAIMSCIWQIMFRISFCGPTFNQNLLLTTGQETALLEGQIINSKHDIDASLTLVHQKLNSCSFSSSQGHFLCD